MDVLAVPEEELDDLRSRLRRTRWATAWPGAGWEAGTDSTELRRLVEYWATGFDWRKQEVALNALPSHFADLDGVPVHYLQYDGEHPGALPIVVTHGWPSSVLELTELAHRLATPSQYGGSPLDSFTVIVPSLPGFAFSPQRPSLPPATATHELWHRLMHNELGFERYGAHGGDLGAGISALLGQTYPESVVGIHVLAVANPAEFDPAEVTPEEQAYLDSESEWFAEEGGYEHEQMTRPVTLSAGLSDSPAGLLSWLLEKYRAWTDCDGDLGTRFSDDFILTQASLYWFTNSIGTSFRPYYEFHRGQRERVTSVTVPTAIAVFPEDLVRPPRRWAARTYNVTRYTAMPRGGHFAAWEEPDLLADDLTAFFRTVR
ncbi:epoxide hydrolase family protein [Streptomyces sp. SID13031]|uniref:epoxide hydrolase family protein n=1 Tax=Streptomyces sp. SID13031 TaxID=2706046 RepID=UPI0031BA6843